MFHGIRGKKLQRLGSSRYFLFAERLPAYQGAVRAALTAELAEDQAANQVPTVPAPASAQQHAPGTTAIASERLPTYSGEALAAMTDDGGMGLPGIEYDGG